MGPFVCPCCCCCYSRAAVRCLHWAAFSSQRGCVWQLTQFGGWKWRSGLNRISHPDWVKLSVELNCAPNQNTKFFPSLHIFTFKFFVFFNNFLHTNVWFQVFLSNTNNSNTVVWLQIFLSNSNNYIVASNYFCLIIIIRFHSYMVSSN